MLELTDLWCAFISAVHMRLLPSRQSFVNNIRQQKDSKQKERFNEQLYSATDQDEWLWLVLSCSAQKRVKSSMAHHLLHLRPPAPPPNASTVEPG